MHFATARASGRVQREARYNEGMRLLALLPIGVLAFVTSIVGAACGGSAFTAGTPSSIDGGASSSSGGSSGGGSGSGSGSSSGSSSSSGGGSGGGSSSGTANDSGTGSSDGGFTTDAAGCAFPPTRCGSMTCNGMNGQQGDLCCVDPAQSPIFGCASCECGCSTQLECAVGADCAGGKVCCIEQQSCGSGSTHWVSSCKALASCGGKRLCNPNGNALVECAGSANASCTTDTSSVGIPSGTGYGYCN